MLVGSGVSEGIGISGGSGVSVSTGSGVSVGCSMAPGVSVAVAGGSASRAPAVAAMVGNSSSLVPQATVIITRTIVNNMIPRMTLFPPR